MAPTISLAQNSSFGRPTFALALALAWFSSGSGAEAQCVALDTTEGAGSFTINSPSYFQMVFRDATSGALSEFYDLEQDPGLDLAGGTQTQGLFYDALGSTQFFIDFWDVTSHGNAGTVHLLEATPTRVRVRQESFYKRLSILSIAASVKGFGDYSVYPCGRVGIRWNRRATNAVTFARTELNLAVHYLGSGPLSTWTGYTDSGTGGFPHSPLETFLLMKTDVPGSVTTDFLHIQYQDWTVANGHQKSATETDWPAANSGQELSTIKWWDSTSTPLAAGYSEVWNYLTYFKPTSFQDHLDAGVTGRRDDYRAPDSLTFNGGAGSAWNDSSESSASDDYNESEAAYVVNFHPALGLDMVIDGGTGSPPTRYEPFFKIRQWRSLQDPSSVTLDGAPLTNDTDYVADVKPLSRAYFAQDVLWHTTFQDPAAVATAPDVGSPGTVNGTTTQAAAKHGQGFLFDAAGEYVTFPSAGNFNLTQGSLELWYQPRYVHTDGVRHVLWHNEGDASHYFLLEKTSANELKLTLQNGASTTSVTVASGSYSWRNRDWVHLAVTWNAGAAVGLQARLYVNGLEPAHTDAGTYSTAGMLAGQNYVGALSGGGNTANGILDELYVTDAPDGPKPMGYAGLTSSASESLASGTQNDPLPFAAVNGLRQGEHFYLGADSEFRGLNVDLETDGAGNSPVLRWQYWNGTAWANLTLNGDETAHFTRRGTIHWTDPADWALYSIMGGPDLYYVRSYLESGDYSVSTPVEGLIKTDILLFQYCSDLTAAGQNFVFGLPTVTAVALASFSAEARNESVELSWETASERDNLGFHLHRSLAEEGPFDRITASLLPGSSTTSRGGSYRYRDSGLTNGRTYFYRLEDVDSTGETRLHGPVSATPSPEAPDDTPARRTAFGDPSSVELRVLERGEGGITLELVTGGFFAEHQADGSMRLQVPGFVDGSESQEGAPVKRSWIEARVGRRVEIASVHASDVIAFDGLSPSAPQVLELGVSRRGTLRAIPRRLRTPGNVDAGGAAASWARILETGFQGGVKKARVELAPLRWDPSSGRLWLAKRLRVELAFSGREASERMRIGRGGTRHREEESHALREVAARLVTRERGLHAVRFEEIFGRRDVAARDASSLQLSRLGRAEAFHLEPQSGNFAPGSTLYFLSEGARSNPYGGEAVYELRIGVQGLQMPLEPAAPEGEPLSFHWSRLQVERNRYYLATLLDAPDRWLWDVLFAPAKRSYPFSLEGIVPRSEPTRLDLWLQGASDFPVLPDHHLRIFVNGFPIAEDYLEGKQSKHLALEIQPDLLRDGENAISIENVGDTAAQHSMVMLDRFELTYPRRSVVEEGRLEAIFPTGGTAEFSGLDAGALVVDVTESRPRWIQNAESSRWGLRFRAAPGHRYLASAPEAVLRPEIRKPLSTRWKSGRNRFEYVMLGPAGLLEAARPLLDLRSSQGLRPTAVPIEEVYSEFGFGEERPEAIRDFLSYAYHHWSSPPRYVVLLGDATYDFKGYLGAPATNQVPPFPIRTSYLWTVSDLAYASVNGDDLLPDLAIGRLPAATPEQAAVLAAKIVAYESQARAPAGRVVLVADDPDRAGDFVAHAEEIASALPGGRPLQRIYLSELGTEGTRRAIASSFDEGAHLMSYVGHGGIHVWADENLLDSARVGSLRPQSRQPLLLTMNCLNGYFQFPYFDSLAEALLKAEGKGAIAAFSPTGMSLEAPAHLFHRALMAELFSDRHRRLGDAILAAQEVYAATGELPELLRIYHLLGDPALELR